MNALVIMLKVAARVLICIGVLLLVSPIFFFISLPLGESMWGLLLWIPYLVVCFLLIRALISPADAAIDRMLGEEDSCSPKS